MFKNIYTHNTSKSYHICLTLLEEALLSKTQVFVKKPEFSQEVVSSLKNKSVGGLWEGKVEQVVRPLEEAGQITKQTIDHTPSRRRRPLGILEQERKPSQKTRRTLQSTLE
ncbi:hypothetical protein cypCar_00037749 [Cyprinus carpio]|nr:hypothetical protein cypCar_00037749 [Cyprinus carpio]